MKVTINELFVRDDSYDFYLERWGGQVGYLSFCWWDLWGKCFVFEISWKGTALILIEPNPQQ